MTSNASASRFQPWMALVLALLVLAVIWFPRSRQYGPVTSRESLVLLQLLNTACNTRDLQRLEQFENRLKELNQVQQKVSAGEQQAYQKIVQLAKSGHWERAAHEALRMAADQVGVGHPDRD